MGGALSGSGRGGSDLLIPLGAQLYPEIVMLPMGSLDAKPRTVVSVVSTAAWTAKGASVPCSSPPAPPRCVTEEEARAGVFQGGPTSQGLLGSSRE